MVQRDVARTRVGRATMWLQDAETLFGQDVEAFLAATKDRDLAIFYLFLALQDCHADSCRSGPPSIQR